jgi:hypothetical protein
LARPKQKVTTISTWIFVRSTCLGKQRARERRKNLAYDVKEQQQRKCERAESERKDRRRWSDE